MWVRAIAAAAFALALCAGDARSEEPSAYVDAEGVARWRVDNSEITLFGANYCAFSGSDYRTAGRVGADRKALIDADMAHFARMGWNGMRLCTWGDWESVDEAGNLLETEHLDLMDYLIAKAKERGVAMLLTPIHTYNPNWPDTLDRTEQMPGFSRVYGRGVLGTDARAIAAQANYIRQLLEHVNPYTGLALKDDPAIPFVEMINEPVHHPDDPGAAAYIDALVDAVRASGSRQITFHNYTQDFRIGPALRDSSVQGVTMGWYPSGLVAGRTLQGNFLQAVDAYPAMLAPELAGMPRIVYEFDQADLLTGYMYPAMARTYRSVGAQFAAIFAYDMLASAPYNLGWQTHYISLVHTPRKAMSAVIAAEAMRRLPRMQSYGRYPETTRFGDFRVSYEDNLSELAARDAFMHAGDTATRAPAPRALTRIAGFGSSPLVSYEGEGAYFLDKIGDGVWRLELYPDSVHVAEPFAQPEPGRVVSRLYFRAWTMGVNLPDLGARFTATPVNVPHNGADAQRARRGVFTAAPGVWLLTRRAAADRAAMPETVSGVGFAEYHVNDPQTYPDVALAAAPREFVAGEAVEIAVRIASPAPPDEAVLHLRRAGAGGFSMRAPLARVRGYAYAARFAAGELAPGLYEYVVTTRRAGETRTFPEGRDGAPGVWPFAAHETWRFAVVAPEAPLTLFDPARDARALSFVRPEEAYRTPFFAITTGETSGRAALELGLPDLGADTPAQYAAALYVGDAVAARGARAARSLGVRLRAVDGARRSLDVLLIEKDGSSWLAAVPAGADWSTQRVALGDLTFARSIHIPSPFPGLWNYWREGPPARAATTIRAQDIERLELRVRPNAGADDARAVAIAEVWLDF